MVDERLEGGPAGVGGGDRRDEEAFAAEVVGLEEVEGLQDVMALSAGVRRGFGATANDGEDGGVEGAWSWGCREGRGREGEEEEGGKDKVEEERGHQGGLMLLLFSLFVCLLLLSAADLVQCSAPTAHTRCFQELKLLVKTDKLSL